MLDKAAAFELGWRWAVKQAAEDGKPSWLRRVLPWAIGGGLGYGAYRLARLPIYANKALYPALHDMQRAVRSEKRVRWNIDNIHVPTGRPNEIIPLLSGARTGEDAKKFQKEMARLIEDRTSEAKLLRAGGTNFGADTSLVHEIARKHGINFEGKKGKALYNEMERLQSVLRKKYKEGFVIKTKKARPTGDPNMDSRGMFPTEQTNFKKEYTSWDRSMKTRFEKAMSRDDLDFNEAQNMFRNSPGFNGRVLEEILHNNAIVQPKLKLRRAFPGVARPADYPAALSEEYRVHVVGGKAVPELTYGRHGVATSQGSQTARTIAENAIRNLPRKFQDASYGMDVGILQSGGGRVIELNPATLAGNSGLLNQNSPHLRRLLDAGALPKGMASALGIGIGLPSAAALYRTMNPQSIKPQPPKK